MTKLAMTVNLTPADVKEAIRIYIENQSGVFTCHDDIHFDVERTYEDRPCGGEGLPRFNGATAKIHRSTK